MLSTKQFNVYPAEKKFVGEASDLGRFFERIYLDACDLGFRLESARTGEETKWYVNVTQTNDDGDIELWDCRPTRETLRKFPQLDGWKIVIFND